MQPKRAILNIMDMGKWKRSKVKLQLTFKFNFELIFQYLRPTMTT